MEHENCIFCKIIKDEIPCYKIYENDDYLAFLDIIPVTEGHTMVIPKKHVQWVWDVADPKGYFEVCQKVAKHFQKISGNDMVLSQVFGEGVAHAHIHIIPDPDKTFKHKLTGFLHSLDYPKLTPETGEMVKNKYQLN